MRGRATTQRGRQRGKRASQRRRNTGRMRCGKKLQERRRSGARRKRTGERVRGVRGKSEVGRAGKATRARRMAATALGQAASPARRGVRHTAAGVAPGCGKLSMEGRVHQHRIEGPTVGGEHLSDDHRLLTDGAVWRRGKAAAYESDRVRPAGSMER